MIRRLLVLVAVLGVVAGAAFWWLTMPQRLAPAALAGPAPNI